MPRVDVLGPVTVTSGGAPVRLGPGRQQAVFVALAMRPGQVVSRAELIAAVWGAAAPASADGSVYTYVSGLRRAVGDAGRELIVSAGNGYSLRVDPRQVDVTLFEELCAEADVLAARGAHRAVAGKLFDALTLWRGEAFAGVPGPFAEEERARLDQSRLRAVETYAKARLELGDHVDVAANLAALVRFHPLRESLRELLMVALARSGRHAEALAVFEDARTTLARELGAQPGPALRQVHADVLAGRDLAAEPLAPKLRVLPYSAKARREHPFVGRPAELDLIRQRLAAPRPGGAIWIEGDQGIGKSELIGAALDGVPDTGTQLGWAVADELAGRFPAQIMLECLGLDRKPPPGESVVTTVERLCAGGPLVLVLDDMQFADAESVLAWRRLCEAVKRLPLLLICAVSAGHGRADLAELREYVESEACEGVSVDLGPLSFAESDTLLSLLVDARPSRVLRRIAARADGNPLYIKEIVAALRAGGAIETAGGIAYVDESTADEAPRTLAAAVERSSKSLPEATKELLVWVAVLGTEATIGTIAVVAERPVRSLVRAVADAVDANVLVEDGLKLGFRHQLMRDTVYGGVAVPTRRVLHRQAARVLAETGAPPHRVAEQLVAAGGDTEPWVAGWLVEHAGELATRAPQVTAELLAQVLDTVEPGDPRREVLLAAEVRVLFQLSRDPEAKARHALALCVDPVRRAEMRQVLAAIINRQGRKDEAIATLTEVPLDQTLPEEWRLRYKSLLAHLRRDTSNADTAEIAAKDAYEDAVAAGDEFLAAHALQTRWLVDSMRRDHVGALRHIDEAIASVAGEPDYVGLHFDLLDNRIYSLQNLDRLDEADAALAAAVELCPPRRVPIGLHVTAAVHNYWRGRWDESAQSLGAVVGDGPSITTYAGLVDAGPARLLLYGLSALIAARRGNHREASAHLDAAEHCLVTTRSERENFDFLLAARALAAVQVGDLARGYAELAPILQPRYAGMMLRHQWLPAIVRVAARMGDWAKVEQAVEVVEFEAAREPVPARAFAALHRCRALLARDPEPALVAVEHYRRVGRPIELASTLGDVADLFAERDRTAEARAASAEAAAIFTRVGAKWDLAQLARPVR